MRRIQLIILFILILLLTVFFYSYFIITIRYDKETFFKIYAKFLTELNEIYQKSTIETQTKSYNDYDLYFQKFISKFLKDKNIYTLDEYDLLFNNFQLNKVVFTEKPKLVLLSKDKKIFKEYEFKKDFNIYVNNFSKPISLTKRGYTIVDETTINPQEGDLILISREYYRENYDDIFYNIGVSAIITDQDEKEIKNHQNLFVSQINTSNITRKTSKGFCKIIVTPPIFSEIARFIYQGYLLKIESNWEINKINYHQNLAFFPGKIKDQLIILDIPVNKNIETISSSLAMVDLLNRNKKKLLKSILFFFSYGKTLDFPPQLNLINNFNRFPINVSSLVLDNLSGPDFHLYSFITIKNGKKVKKLADNIIQPLKNEKIEYFLNFFDTEHQHFPYLFNKIPSITISTDSTNEGSADELEKGAENTFKITNILLKYISKAPLIYYLIFYALIFILIFVSVLIIIFKSTKKESY